MSQPISRAGAGNVCCHTTAANTVPISRHAVTWPPAGGRRRKSIRPEATQDSYRSRELAPDAALVIDLVSGAFSLSAEPKKLPVPGLGADLNGFPRAAQRRGVGKIEIAHGLDGHLVEDGCRGDVDPLGDLGTLVAEELHA